MTRVVRTHDEPKLLEGEQNNIEKHLVQNSSNSDDADGGGPSNNSLYGGF